MPTRSRAPHPLPSLLRQELGLVYRRLEQRLRGLGVGCWVHGSCCDFDRQEHRLLASSVEVAYAREKPQPDGQERGSLCPFWIERRCTARDHRPLGCRTYFCDPRYRVVLEALYEEHYREIQALAERYEYPWYYGSFVDGVRSEPEVDTG